jgi:hypothetical protein
VSDFFILEGFLEFGIIFALEGSLCIWLITQPKDKLWSYFYAWIMVQHSGFIWIGKVLSKLVVFMEL